MIARTLLSLAAALALASPVLHAQNGVTVSPANRVLVIDEGKSASVKIKLNGCKPTWSASSDDENIASVSDPGTKANSSRSFKVSAQPGTFGSSTTVTITLDGAGGKCAQTVEVEIQVFVVMDRKHVEKAFTNGDKGTSIPGVNRLMGEYKKAIKAAEKDLKAEYLQILKDMKAGTLPSPTEGPPPPGSPTLNQQQRAMIFMSLAYMGFINTVYGLYWGYLPQMSNCGYNALYYYGFLPFLAFTAPLGMQPGGCGSWDRARLGLFAILAGSITLMNAQSKKFTSSVKKAAAKQGQPLVGNDIGNDVSDPGDGGQSPLGVNQADRALNKRLEIIRLRAHNSTQDGNTSNGRITVMGQSAGSSVNISFQQVDSNGNSVGMPQQDDFPVDTDNCAFGVFWPPLGSTPNLAPGTWRVSVTDGDNNTTTQTIAIPVS
ncbi:MAG: hypothetical protein DRQ55_06810 [Planctomycetota bacterium]|nr:MAG: hypothetical protein DRQ55_06810 [Planctomycetota bacterium]